jgi:hypothetical protein
MIKKILISLFGLLFTGGAVATIFLSGISKTLSNEDFYKNQLAEQGHKTIISYLTETIEEKTEIIPKEVIAEIIEKNIKQEELGGFLRNIYLEISKSEIRENELDIEVSTELFFEKKDQIFEDLIDYKLENLPKCEIANQENCIPENIAKEDFKAQSLIIFQNNILTEIPQTFAFNILVEIDYEGPLDKYLSQISGMFFSVTRAFLFFFLVIIALIVTYPWQAILRTEAKVIASTCLTLMILSVIILSPLYSDEISAINSENLMLSGIYILLRETAKPILLWSSIIFVITIGIRIALRKYYKKDAHNDGDKKSN